MDEEQLNLVEEELNKLIRRFKRNNTTKDQIRLNATIDAKNAIRKVTLLVALSGSLKSIKPIFDRKRGTGWEIVDGQGVRKKVFSDVIVKS